MDTGLYVVLFTYLFIFAVHQNRVGIANDRSVVWIPASSEWNYTHIPPFLLFHEQGTRANWLLQTKIAVVVLLRLLSNMVLQANTSRLTATQLSSLNGTHVRSKSLWSHSVSRFDLKVPLKKTRSKHRYPKTSMSIWKWSMQKHILWYCRRVAGDSVFGAASEAKTW